jgi:DNA polymerase III alpha subunit
MFFAGLEDTTGKTEVVVFPRLAAETEAFWQEGSLILVDGKVSRRDGDPKCMADSVSKLSPDDRNRFLAVKKARDTYGKKSVSPSAGTEQTVVLFLDGERGASAIDGISTMLKTCPAGETRVFVSLGGTKIRTSFSITPNESVLERLKGIEGVKKIASD